MTTTLTHVPTLAVVIPVLNEAVYIAHTLDHLQHVSAWNECLVVDGGSTDNTVKIISTHALKPTLLSVRGGRAAQLNAALQQVQSDIVLIISADCRLSARSCALIRSAAKNGSVAGCLRIRNATQHPLFRWQDRWASLRTRWTSGAYLDQAPFFLRRQALQHRFRALGGYDTADLGRRVTKRGTLTILPAAVVSSCRHWHRHGFWRGTWMHQRLRLRQWFQHT